MQKIMKTTPALRSQRGAMFGLDARIALAIFAGLSVVAGMAVFGTIRQTDVTSLVSEFDNISKGYINYTFDTGIDVPVGTSAGQGVRALFENTATPTIGWDGPYITRSSADHPRFGTYEIERGFIDVNGQDPTVTTGGSVNGAWLELTSIPCEIAQDLETTVDGASGANTTGNLRYPTVCNAGNTGTVYYLLSRTM